MAGWKDAPIVDAPSKWQSAPVVDAPEAAEGQQVSQDALDRAAAADQIAMDRMTLAGNMGGGIAAKAMQGVPFVGEYVDEAFDALDPGRGQRVRDLQGAMDRERPGLSMASEIGGGILGSVPMAVAAAPVVSGAAPASMTGRVLMGSGAGLAAGATEGAVSGYGRGTNPDERRENAVSDGVIGGGLGAVLGAAGPMVAKAGENFVNWLKSSEVGSIAKELGVSTKAAKIIRQAMDGEDMAAATARVSRLGDDAMLADAGPQSAQLLDTVMSEGGPALSTGKAAISGRAAETTPALRRTFDAILGEPKGVRSGVRDIAQGSARARQRAYQAAYDTPTPTVGPKAAAIDSVLARVPPKTMQSAVNEANEAMQEAGTRNMNIKATIADDGSVTFSQPLNIQQLDEIKKALGKVAQDNKDAVTGQLNAAGLRANKLARDLKTALSDAVPVYGRAVKLGGDKISEQNALLLGRSTLNNGTSVEDVAAAFKDASKAEKTAFKQGLREAIEDTMSRVKAVASDPDTGAREAQKIWSEMSSRKTRDKVEAAIGKASANRLWSLMERELPMLQTRSAVARGSQTASRLSGSRAIDDVLSPGVAGTLARGEALDTGKRLLQVVNNTTPGADAARRAKVLGEVAQVLTSRKGRGAQRALSVVQNAMDGKQITEAQAAMIGRYLGSSAAAGGYQIGTQSLQTP